MVRLTVCSFVCSSVLLWKCGLFVEMWALCGNVGSLQVANYARLFANPLTAARRGYIDDVIEPEVRSVC